MVKLGISGGRSSQASHLEVNGIILAGGGGTRLGADKALEKVGRESLLQLAVNALGALCRRIIVVIGKERTLPSLNPGADIEVVSDIYPGKGSLGGIYTGLASSEPDYNLAVACDMPFLQVPLLRYMVEQAEGYDAVLPRSARGIEPLHAVYGRSCLPHLLATIAADRLSVRYILRDIRVRYIEADEIKRYDPERLSLFNINNRKELETARKIAGDLTGND